MKVVPKCLGKAICAASRLRESFRLNPKRKLFLKTKASRLISPFRFSQPERTHRHTPILATHLALFLPGPGAGIEEAPPVGALFLHLDHLGRIAALAGRVAASSGLHTYT